MSTAQSMTATARPEHRSPVDPSVTVVEASNNDLRAELAYRRSDTYAPAQMRLLERADSYASDARKFADMAHAWDVSSKEQAKARKFAIAYRLVADELRKIADSL